MTRPFLSKYRKEKRCIFRENEEYYSVLRFSQRPLGAPLGCNPKPSRFFSRARGEGNGRGKDPSPRPFSSPLALLMNLEGFGSHPSCAPSGRWPND